MRGRCVGILKVHFVGSTVDPERFAAAAEVRTADGDPVPGAGVTVVDCPRKTARRRTTTEVSAELRTLLPSSLLRSYYEQARA